MLQLFQMWLASKRDEEAQGLVEYALIIALVAIFVIVGLGLLGTNLNLAFSALGSWVQTNITAKV